VQRFGWWWRFGWQGVAECAGGEGLGHEASDQPGCGRGVGPYRR
jgi:hypothetical protein